MNKSLMNVEQH